MQSKRLLHTPEASDGFDTISCSAPTGVVKIVMQVIDSPSVLKSNQLYTVVYQPASLVSLVDNKNCN